MNTKNCSNCEYKRIESNVGSEGHCYMFKQEPDSDCAQFKPINVGTIGHISHGRTTNMLSLATALLMLNVSSLNAAETGNNLRVVIDFDNDIKPLDYPKYRDNRNGKRKRNPDRWK